MNIDAQEAFDFTELTTKEVADTLTSINPRKAVGFDNLHPKILKLCAKEVAPSLTKIFNTSIKENVWPENWKLGEWIPIYKKDDRTKDKNYRPVTVLSSIDKVYEKLLSVQTTGYMEPKLSNNMTAYRKKHSCETTILRLVENWKIEVDNKKIVGVVSTDMSKAFDSLYPPLIIKKLEAYNFSENSLKLLRSYFKNRMNRVKLGSATSTWKTLERGCPQGSTFGPMLWNIFQNDLTYTISNSKISMYADDHQIFAAGNTVEEVKTKLEHDVNTTTRWYEENLLSLNLDKFQTMVMGPRDKDKTMTIDISNNTIEQSTSIKLLGVEIDEQLNFNKHISEVSKKVSK